MDLQIYRFIDRFIDLQIGLQIYRYIYRLIDLQIGLQIYRQVYIFIDRLKYRLKIKFTDKKIKQYFQSKMDKRMNQNWF